VHSHYVAAGFHILRCVKSLPNPAWVCRGNVVSHMDAPVWRAKSIALSALGKRRMTKVDKNIESVSSISATSNDLGRGKHQRLSMFLSTFSYPFRPRAERCFWLATLQCTKSILFVIAIACYDMIFMLLFDISACSFGATALSRLADPAGLDAWNALRVGRQSDFARELTRR